MLPYSPLHHLLLEDFGAALVATSGNVSGEPVLTEPEEVEERLAAWPTASCITIARSRGRRMIRSFGSSRAVARPLRLGRGTAPLEL